MKTRLCCACGRSKLPPYPGQKAKFAAPVTHVRNDGAICEFGRDVIPDDARQALDSVEHWTDLLDLPKWSVGDAVTWETLERRWDLPRKHGGRVIALHPTKDYPIGVRLDDGDVIDPSICPGALRLA